MVWRKNFVESSLGLDVSTKSENMITGYYTRWSIWEFSICFMRKKIGFGLYVSGELSRKGWFGWSEPIRSWGLINCRQGLYGVPSLDSADSGHTITIKNEIHIL